MNGEGEVGSDADLVCEPTVAAPARETGEATEVLASGGTEPTLAACACHPTRAGPIAYSPILNSRTDSLHNTDDLVPWNDRGTMRGQIAFDDLKIRSTYRASAHLDG